MRRMATLLVLSIGVNLAQQQHAFDVASVKPNKSSDLRMAFHMESPHDSVRPTSR